MRSIKKSRNKVGYDRADRIIEEYKKETKLAKKYSDKNKHTKPHVMTKDEFRKRLMDDLCISEDDN